MMVQRLGGLISPAIKDVLKRNLPVGRRFDASVINRILKQLELEADIGIPSKPAPGICMSLPPFLLERDNDEEGGIVGASLGINRHKVDTPSVQPNAVNLVLKPEHVLHIGVVNGV